MKMILAPMILGALMTAPESKPVETVLFVCEHGSAKSVVAAAHFNRIAADRGLPFRAISRGTIPDAEMAPPAVKGLLGDGLKPGDPTPAKLEQSDLDTALRVVTFCDLPPGSPGGFTRRALGGTPRQHRVHQIARCHARAHRATSPRAGGIGAERPTPARASFSRALTKMRRRRSIATSHGCRDPRQIFPKELDQ